MDYNDGYANSKAQAYANQAAQATNVGVPTPEPRLRSQIHDLANLLTKISHQTTILHGRIVPPAPQATGENTKNGEPRTYEQMLDTLIHAVGDVHQRLAEISERV